MILKKKLLNTFKNPSHTFVFFSALAWQIFNLARNLTCNSTSPFYRLIIHDLCLKFEIKLRYYFCPYIS